VHKHWIKSAKSCSNWFKLNNLLYLNIKISIMLDCTYKFDQNIYHKKMIEKHYSTKWLSKKNKHQPKSNTQLLRARKIIVFKENVELFNVCFQQKNQNLLKENLKVKKIIKKLSLKSSWTRIRLRQCLIIKYYHVVMKK